MKNIRHAKKAFTLVELLVVIGIIALLISILLPSLNRAREAANSVKCLSNLKQIGNAILMYGNDNKQYLVPGSYKNFTSNQEVEYWGTILVAGKYLKVPQIAASTSGNSFQDTSADFGSVFRCPTGMDNRWGVTGNNSDPTSFNTDLGRQFFRQFSTGNNIRVDTWYAINGWPTTSAVSSFKRWPFTQLSTSTATGTQQSLHRLGDFKNASGLVMVSDGLGWLNQVPYRISSRHNGKKYANVLLADGHAEPMRCPDDVPMVTDTSGNLSLKKFVPNGTHFIISQFDSIN